MSDTGLSFSALRAPNGRLFRAPRSKAQEGTEMTDIAYLTAAVGVALALEADSLPRFKGLS